MIIKIFQIQEELDNNKVLFCNYKETLKLLKSEKINLKPYKLVYTANYIKNLSLDSIYEKFNCDLPDDYSGRSLSVSDIIYIKNTYDEGYYFVDSFGFVKIDYFKLCEIIE